MGIIDLVQLVFGALNFIILAGIVLSWIRIGTRDASWLYHPVILFIWNLSNRILRPFRPLYDALLRALNIRPGPLDFSPILAVVCLNLLERVIISVLLRLGIY
jgi:YggT family protein